MKKIFDNTQIAFALKSNSQLNASYFLFKIMALKPLVKIGTKIISLALQLNLPVENLIRKSIFNQFCGGINEEDCLKVVDILDTKGVSSVLDYAVEGKASESEFDNALQKMLKIIEFAKERQAIPFAVFKPTSFGRIDLYEKIGNKEVLNYIEQEEWSSVEARFDWICNAAFQKSVPILIDAEESWMQTAADKLILEMMRKYNKEKVIVYSTLQMYRQDRMDYLKILYQTAQAEGFFIGIKLVRGAYMEKENDRAEEDNYPSPIFSSKPETDQNYDAALQYIINNLDVFSLFAGTHNEASAYYLMELMQEKNIATNDVRIWFGQLYGMSDTMSFNLAANGYNVAKYLPFGPVKEVVPYLIRRAQENTAVAGQTSRELEMIIKERQRRKRA
ncbi:proline dehydrogenase family protein [Flavobacterium undicola]|uniref:proline dehydrogenase family protein n=1 Tax=Flavobacterium undicola TaxID=1932779 RepID=UPI001376C43E|nr:proline dehydrogenase family protein [Flavobacterium undicola]MBA0885361.1 proline dehydrogenase family protein [Flavobacterium undicola]